MRNLILGFLAIAFMFSCTTEPQYNVSVKVDGLGSGIAYLYDGSDVVDSVNYENGEFTFTGSVELPEFRVIEFSDTMDIIQLFVENTEVNVTIVVGEEPVVTGGVANEKFNEYQAGLGVIRAKMVELRNAYYAAQMANDQEKLEELSNQAGDIYNEQDAFNEEYVKANTDCVVGAYVANRRLISGLDINQLDSLINTFDPAIGASVYIAKMNEYLEVLKRVDIGQPFVEITQLDVNDQELSLSQFAGQGSYVLIDFWASWCGPCRHENPNLVANYAKYHDKGFEIFAVSYDDNKDKWLKGIEEDGLTWPQVSDLQGWGNASAKLYGIRFIPQNVLLDPEGVIIAKNLRGEDLGAKLVEIFGE